MASIFSEAYWNEVAPQIAEANRASYELGYHARNNLAGYTIEMAIKEYTVMRFAPAGFDEAAFRAGWQACSDDWRGVPPTQIW